MVEAVPNQRATTAAGLRRRFERLARYFGSLGPIALGMRPFGTLVRLLLRGTSGEPLAVELRASGARFLVPSRMGVWILKEVGIDRQYEREGAPLEDGWMVLDVGAGIGEFCLDAARRFPASRFVAFEPSPAAYALLVENLRANGVENVRALPYAVGGFDGEAAFDLSPRETVLHRLAGEEGARHRETISVACRSLDSLFTELAIERCDLLKVDCEGGEHALFAATSPATLERIRRIVLELHGDPRHDGTQIETRLRSAGFRLRPAAPVAPGETAFLFAWRD